MKETLHLKRGTIALILNFLTNRYVKFRIGQTLSEPLLLEAGTPQGSILSPTLFNIGVSDIPQPDNENVELSQYADDIGTWAKGKDKSQTLPALQNYNNRIVEWCKEWKIKLAPNKTQMIEFKRKHPNKYSSPIIYINGTEVECKSQATFLGITFHQTKILSKQHILTRNQIKSRIGALGRITGTHLHPRASEKLGYQIFKSMIYSLTQYAPTAQVIKPDKNFEEIDRILTSGLRKVLHLPKHISGDYVRSKIPLADTKSNTIRLAKKYVENPNRPFNFQNYVRNQNLIKDTRRRRHIQMTPLNQIYPI